MKKVLMVGLQDACGGMENFALNFFKYTDKSKIHYDFTNARAYIYFQDYFIKNGAAVYDIPHEKKHPIKHYKSFVEVMKNYDTVHINMLSAANILPVMAAKKSGVKKIIVHSHNTGTVGIVRNVLHNLFKFYLRKNATTFFACSRLAGEWMFGKKITEQNNFYVINNAIDTEKFKYNEEIRNKIRKEYGIENNFVIGHVGRFSKQKNHEFLIEIFKEVYKQNSNARLLLVGDGELKEQIKAKVHEYKLDSAVVFTGVCDNVSGMYQAMDVFCMPSLFEGLPVVMVEVQAAGVRCVISDTITRETDITGDVDFVSLDDSVSVWSDKLDGEIGFRYDAAAGTEKYDIRFMAKETEKIYLER